MNMETKYMLSSFRDVSERKKLQDTQRALISKSMDKYADMQSLSKQKSFISVSSSFGTSYATPIETSMTNVGKRKPYGYLTLLDIMVLGGDSVPESSIIPKKELVPNPFHQPHNESRWRFSVEKSPTWILKMGMEALNEQRKESRDELLNPHILRRWTPILVEPDKLKFTGYLQSASSPEVLHVTDTIAARKDFDCVQCDDGTVYKLQGPFEDPKHNIPGPIKQLLRQGLPCNWKMMMENWVSLLAQVKEQGKETAKSIATVTNQVGHVKNTEKAASFDVSVVKKAAQHTANLMSPVRHTESTENTANFDESFVTKPVQPTASMTKRIKHVKSTEYADASDELVAEVSKKDSVNKGAARKSLYKTGSLIPLKELDGQGVVQTSSRGRIIVPPVRYWLGERLLQQDNQATFFSPKPGVTQVVVNQSVDSIGHQKKRKESESDARTLTVTKKRHSRTVTHYGSERKLQTMRKERTTLSHITPIVLLQKFDMNVSQATRTPEGEMYNIKRQKSLLLKQKECDMRLCESDDTMSDATFSEVRNNSTVFNKHESKFKTPIPVTSKLASASSSMKDGTGKRKKHSLWSEERGGLHNIEEFKTRRLKQKRNACPSISICDSEEDQLDDTLLADLPTDINSMAFRASTPLSSVSAPVPKKHLNSTHSTKGTEPQTGSPGKLLEPHIRKEIEKLIERQQRLMGRDTKKLLKPTTRESASKVTTINNRAGSRFTVQIDEMVDKASSFDDDDFSSSYFSTEDKL